MISTLALPEAARRARARKNGDKRVDFGQSFHELKEGWRFIFVEPDRSIGARSGSPPA